MSQEFTPQQEAANNAANSVPLVGTLADLPEATRECVMAYGRCCARTYAATLRQQAARVDDADVRLLMTVLSGEHGGDHADDGCDVCSAFTRIEAALSAQPAPERQGEAIHQRRRICRCRPNDSNCICNTGWEDVSAEYRAKYEDDEDTDWRTVYTHPAAPVGVPDAAINILRRSRDDADLVPLYRQAMRDAVAQLETFNLIAAAPSAPQGTQPTHPERK